ncbi:MAG: ATP-dependent zinc metalloprotease FtsH [Bacilli bacterium]
MQKKRSVWLTVLIYIIIGVFSIVIIYMIVSGLNQKYTTISTSQFVTYVYDGDDNYAIKQAEIQTDNENQVTVNMIVHDTSNNSDKYYTITTSKESVYEEKWGYTQSVSEAIKEQTDTFGTEGYFNTTVYQENVFLSWLPTIISTIVILGIAIFFFRFLMSSAGGNKQAMDFNKSTARRVDNSKVRFKDVAGCDEEKAEMVELVDYLKEPKKYTKCGAKLPKGILLVGPPGTGKTLLAKAVAGEAGVPFYSISGSDFVEMFVGVGAGRVRDLFKTAKQNAPCLIFIDEIDAVGRQRGAGLGGGNDEREQTLNQLLVELDGFEENSGIIVIAATNRDDVLDPALLRAGRFDRKITVNLPDREGREAIFKVHAIGKKLAPEVDFKQFAKRTVGFSGADIANILNEAAILAVRGNRELITSADIDEAIDRRIAGPAKSTKGMNDLERRQVAYHEAGHAIIGLSLKDSDKVRKITIIPRGNTGGHVLMGPEDDRFLLTKKELEARICGYLGGRTSEEVFFNDISTGASNDIEMATQIARSMVVEYGMSPLGPIQYEKDSGSVFLGRDYNNAQKNFSVAVADEIDKEVRRIIEDAHKQATEIITKRKEDVKLIAETLLETETINEEEIDYLLKNRKMPDEAVKQKDAARECTTNMKEKEDAGTITSLKDGEGKEEPKDK